MFPYGLRFTNFLAVSNSSITVGKDRWISTLRPCTIDGWSAFDPIDPVSQKMLPGYTVLADTLREPPRLFGLESFDSLRMRVRNRLIMTDDNMGLDWRKGFTFPWY